MLSDKERRALEQWYGREATLDHARELLEAEAEEELEEYLHMICLLPLAEHNELPAFMLTDEGKPVFPTNLNPQADLEKWQDAIEVGWAVMEKQLRFSHDDVHRRIAAKQDRDWQDFLARAEQRRTKKS